MTFRHWIMEEHIQKLLDSKIHAKYKLLIRIQLRCGLRLSEVLKLKLDDLESDNNLFRLKKQKNGLENGVRYMDDVTKKEILEFVVEYKKNIEKCGGYLIFNKFQKRPKPINPHSACQCYKDWCIRLGIRTVVHVSKVDGRTYASNTPHALRAKSITRVAKVTARKYGAPNPYAIMLHAGHTSIQSAKPYINFDEDMVKWNGETIAALAGE